MNNLISVLDEKTTHVFQPIYNVEQNTVLGYEALLRNKSFNNPEHYFSYVKNLGCLYHCDTLSIRRAIKTFNNSDLTGVLFLNVFPSTLLHKNFEIEMIDIFKSYPSIKGKVVFELNENLDESLLWNNNEIIDKTNLIKKLGCKIAIDDVGEGAASLKNVISLSPDFVKLDKFFTKNIAASEEKKKIVSLFIAYCGRSNLIVEGIETAADLQALKSLSVQFAQGYLLGRPFSVEELIKVNAE